MADPNFPGPSNNYHPNEVAANADDAPNNNNINDFINGATSIDIFKEICGVNDETAAQLLRESGGNLEAAIHQFFFTHENPEIIENQNNEHQEIRQRRARAAPEQNQLGVQNEVVPIRRPMTWGQWISALVMLPFRFFYSTLTECLTFFYHLLVGPPTQRQIQRRNHRAIQNQNVIQDRMIMRAQQEEYNQALAIDREKAAEKKRQENVEQEERRKAKEQLERLEARSARLKQRRIEIAQKMTQDIEAVQNEQELIRIRVSFPNGAKLERRFIIQESLERLFESVFIHPECPEHFSLLTTYPSILLHCAPDWYLKEFGQFEEKAFEPIKIKTFAEQGLLTSMTVIVRDEDA